jgi:hypothetical protein
MAVDRAVSAVEAPHSTWTGLALIYWHIEAPVAHLLLNSLDDSERPAFGHPVEPDTAEPAKRQAFATGFWPVSDLYVRDRNLGNVSALERTWIGSCSSVHPCRLC